MVGGICVRGGTDAGVVRVVWYPVIDGDVNEEDKGEKGNGEAGVEDSGELADVGIEVVVMGSGASDPAGR